MAVVNLGNDSLLMGRRRRRSRRRRGESDSAPASYSETATAEAPALEVKPTSSNFFERLHISEETRKKLGLAPVARSIPQEEPAPTREAPSLPAPAPQEAPASEEAEGQEAPQTMGRRYKRVSLRSFIKSFRRMNKAQRRAAWRAIPKAQKAAWLFIAGPILLPLIAAAGVAVTSTAALNPVAAAAMIARASRRKRRGRTPHTLAAFVRNFRRMSPAERRAAWRAIPRIRKAAWLMLAGPLLLPLLAAAGVVVTSTAAAAPFALLAIRARIKKRRARLAALRRQQVEAHTRVIMSIQNGDKTGEAKAIVDETNAKSEIATETNALKSDEDQVSTVHKDAGGTGEEEKTPEASPEAVAAAEAGGVKKKSNAAALVPLGALAALMFL
jgi:hypothetical protein